MLLLLIGLLLLLLLVVDTNDIGGVDVVETAGVLLLLRGDRNDVAGGMVGAVLASNRILRLRCW